MYFSGKDTTCNKRGFDSRSQARKAQKHIPGETLHTYRCSRCGYYHLGHIPKKVKTGEVPSYDFYSWSTTYRPHNSRRRVAPCVLEHIFKLEASGELDRLGLIFTNTIAAHYRSTNTSPTWRELFSNLPPHWQTKLFTPSPEWKSSDYYWRESVKKTLMETLRKRGWIKFNGMERSLQCGERITSQGC